MPLPFGLSSLGGDERVDALDDTRALQHLTDLVAERSLGDLDGHLLPVAVAREVRRRRRNDPGRTGSRSSRHRPDRRRGSATTTRQAMPLRRFLRLCRRRAPAGHRGRGARPARRRRHRRRPRRRRARPDRGRDPSRSLLPERAPERGATASPAGRLRRADTPRACRSSRLLSPAVRSGLLPVGVRRVTGVRSLLVRAVDPAAGVVLLLLLALGLLVFGVLLLAAGTAGGTAGPVPCTCWSYGYCCCA